MQETKHLVKSEPNPFKVLEYNVNFDKTCQFPIGDTLLSFDYKATVGDLLKSTGVTEVYATDGRIVLPTVVIHDLFGLRLVYKNMRIRLTFYKPRKFRWNGPSGVSPQPGSVDCIKEVKELSQKYQKLWPCGLKAAGWRLYRQLVHSAMTYILSHREVIDRVLAKFPHPSYITSTDQVFKDMQEAKDLQDPDSVTEVRVDDATHKRWSNILRVGLSLVEHADAHWARL